MLNRELTNEETETANTHLAVPFHKGVLCRGSPRHNSKLDCQHRHCNSVLVEFGRGENNKIPVTRLKIRCLRLGEWLNDEVANYVLSLYQARNDAATAGDGLLPCYFFNTMFYPTLVKHGYPRVRRHTLAKHKIDIFAQALIFVPIHCGTNHWTLAVVNSLDRRFEYFDSCGGPDNGVLRNVRSYVAEEMKDKRGVAIWDDSKWTDHVWKYEDGTPQQGEENGSDCGLFMLKTADLLSQNGCVDVEQVLSPKHPSTHTALVSAHVVYRPLLYLSSCAGRHAVPPQALGGRDHQPGAVRAAAHRRNCHACRARH